MNQIHSLPIRHHADQLVLAALAKQASAVDAASALAAALAAAAAPVGVVVDPPNP